MNKWKVCKSCGGVFTGNNNDRTICPQCNGKLELIQSNIPMMETCDITAISHDFNFIKSMMELYDTNIIEYKSPSDSLSVDDFYKVYGYTNFYKADTGKVNEIPIQELTITLVSKRYPRELIRHLKEVRHYTIDNPEEGIYYVIGDILPIQVLVTNQLSPEKNLWLYSLTDTLEDMSVTRQLLEDYKKNKENQLYQSVMEIIVKANENRLKEGKRDMCNALLELMKDELDEKREEGIREGIKEGESLGENRINQLILKLSELNRTDEILKAAADREYQKKLLKEFGL